MHLLIPYAAVTSEAGAHALSTLSLPNLQALLARLTQACRDDGDEDNLSPPHERALARALGWPLHDGQLPWAARQAVLDGIATGDRAWGLLTPTHWEVGSDQITLADPALLALDEGESRALFDAVQPLFESEGITLTWGAPLRWYAAHASLGALATASIDRVVARSVDRWLPPRDGARLMRRLQNEVQMLLYTHPINDQREARGAMVVNSFWLSGCGVQQAAAEPADLHIDDSLRHPALTEDWAAWADAWHAIDAGIMARASKRLQSGEPVCLTLCGERSAVQFDTQPIGLLHQLRRRFSVSSPLSLLASL